jgi:hypothetical protein
VSARVQSLAELQVGLDEMLADYLREQSGALPSQVRVMDLLAYNQRRIDHQARLECEAVTAEQVQRHADLFVEHCKRNGLCTPDEGDEEGKT